MSTYGMTFTRKTHAPAYGTPEGNRRKIGFGLDHDEMVRLSKIAEKEQVSFAELLRRICKAYQP